MKAGLACGRRWIGVLAMAACVAVLLGCAGTSSGPGTTSSTETRPAPAESEQALAERRARVRLELAAAYFSRGQFDTALEEIRLSLAARPDLAEGYNLRGLVHGALGDAQAAEASFQRALQINPRDADTMHNLGWLMCQLQRYTESVAQFDRALAQPQYRDVVRTQQARGLCLARAGRWEEAEASLMRAYELDPSNPGASLNLAEVLYRRGAYERARFYIGRTNSQPSSVNAQTLWLAARIEHKAGNVARSRQLGDELRNRFPQAPETLAFERGQFDD